MLQDIWEDECARIVWTGLHRAVGALEYAAAAACDLLYALLTQHVVAGQQLGRVVCSSSNNQQVHSSLTPACHTVGAAVLVATSTVNF